MGIEQPVKLATNIQDYYPSAHRHTRVLFHPCPRAFTLDFARCGQITECLAPPGSRPFFTHKKTAPGGAVFFITINLLIQLA